MEEQVEDEKYIVCHKPGVSAEGVIEGEAGGGGEKDALGAYEG